MSGLFVHLQLAVLTSRAQAAEPGPRRKVAVFVQPTSTKDALHAKVLQTLLRRELGHFEGVDAVTGSPSGDGEGRGKASLLVEEGYRAIHAKDKAKALEGMKGAYDLLMQTQGPLDIRLAARASKGLAVAEVMNGRLDAAKALIRTSLFLWPGQRADEYLYTMEARDAVKSVLAAVAAEATGQLQVSSEPPGGAIWVDGTFRAYTPDTVVDLAPGPHLVQVQLDGYQFALAQVEVPSGAAATHAFTLELAPGGDTLAPALAGLARKGVKEAQARPLVEAIRTLIGSDGVLALQVMLKGHSYALAGWYGAADAIQQVKTEIAQDAQAIVNLRGVLSSTLGAAFLEPDPPGALDAPPGISVVTTEGEQVFIDLNDPIFKAAEKEEDSVVTEWWFWTIIGAAAAGLVIGAVFLFQPQEEGKGPVGTLEIQLGDPQ
jgi:hypothetical protein